MSMDVASIPWHGTRTPGVAIHGLWRDPASGDTAVLVRMDPARGYPPHRHVGDEEVFVLQGGYRDRFGIHRVGQFVRNAAGTTHAPVALEGEPCVLFAMAHGGIDVLAAAD